MQELILSIRNSLDYETPPAQTLKEAFDQDMEAEGQVQPHFNVFQW